MEKEEKVEMYLCGRPVRKVALLGTVVDLRLKSTRDDTTKGEGGGIRLVMHRASH
jgi:hypothetical protein